MKKTRILSMLLSATLALSSFPMMASAAASGSIKEGAEIFTDVEDASKWTATGAQVTSKTIATNKYFRVYDRLGNGNGIDINTGITASGTFKISLKVRTQSDKAADLRIYHNAWSSANMLYGSSITATTDGTSWQEISSKEFTYTADTAIKFIVIGLYDWRQVAPFEIDDFTVYKKNGNGGFDVLAKYDMDNTSIPYTQRSGGKSVVATETAQLQFSGADAAKTNDQMAADHSASYKKSVTLDSGVYELSGDIRMLHYYLDSAHNAGSYSAGVKGVTGTPVTTDFSVAANYVGKRGWATSVDSRSGLPTSDKYYHILFELAYPNETKGQDNGVNVADANYRDVKLALMGDGAAVVADTITFDENWTNFKYTVEVPAGETLTIDGVTFNGTGKAYDNDPFNVDNLSLKKVYDYKDTVQDASGALIDAIALDEFTASNGTAQLTTDKGAILGNQYLSFTDRLNNGDSILITYNGTVPAETTDQYELKFDVRVPADIKTAAGALNNKVQFRIYKNGGAIAANVTPTNLDSWQTVTVDYDATVAQAGYKVTGGPGLGFSAHNGAAPYEIDNVRIVKKGTEEVVSGICDNFDGYTVAGDSVTGESFTYTVVRAYSAYNNAVTGHKAVLSVETEESFVNAAFNGAAGTVSYTPDEDIVLAPGYYFIKGQFRNAEYVGAGVLNMSADSKSAYIIACPDTGSNGGTPQRIIYNNNAVEVVAGVELGDGTFVGESTAFIADTAWNEVVYSFRVDEETTLSKVEFDVAHVLNGSTLNPKATVDFKNVEIYSYLDGETEVEDGNFDILDISEANVVSTGDTYIASNDGLILGNKYLSFYSRINNNDGILIKLSDKVPAETASAQYEIKFDVRVPVDIKKGDGTVNNKFVLRTYIANEAGNGVSSNTAYSYVTFSNINEWQTYTIDLDAATFANGYLLRGGPGLGFDDHNSSAPFEIDNVRIVYKGTEDIVDGICMTFDGETTDGVCVSDEYFDLDIVYAYAGAANGKSSRFGIETDEMFYRTEFNGTAGTFTYTLADDTVLVPGSYIFTGMFRNAEYVNAGVAKELDKTGEDVTAGIVGNGGKVNLAVIDDYANYGYIVAELDTGDRLYPQRIAYDNNAVNIEAVIITDTNGTERVRTAEVLRADAGWTEFEYIVILKEETTLKSITFNVTHALDGSPVNVDNTYVDFKGLQIEFNPIEEEKGGIPNIGIVMMLIAKRTGNINKLPTAELAPVTDASKAGEAVTEFDASAFKADIVNNGGNKYMTNTKRINNGDGITVKDIGLNLDAAKRYEVKFDIRASVDVVKIAGHNEGQSYVRVWYGQNAKTGVEAVYTDDAWTTVTVPYVAEQVTGGLHIVGGIGATYSNPFDIDNVRVVEAGTDNVVAIVDFEDMDTAVYAADQTVSKNGFEFVPKYMYSGAVNGKDATIAIEADTAYARAGLSGASATVNYKTEAALEPGTYTLTAMVRNGLYNGSNNDISVNTAPNYIMREPDDSTTTTRQRITENNNYVNVYAMVVTDSVLFTSKEAPVKAYSAWTAVEYTFTVEEAVSVSSIRFGGTHALLDTDLAVKDITLDVKDVVISKAK